MDMGAALLVGPRNNNSILILTKKELTQCLGFESDQPCIISTKLLFVRTLVLAYYPPMCAVRAFEVGGQH